MLYSLQDLSVVIPTLNERHSVIERVVGELKRCGAEVIVVDDGSRKPYPDSIKHGMNYGYGAALMTGIKNAKNAKILTMDGDGQHNVQDVINLHKVFNMLDADMVVGRRRLKHESSKRFWGRKFLNTIASVLAMCWLADLNSGMRIFRKSVVYGYFPILCKQFSFTTSLTMSMMCDGYRVEFFPITVAARASGRSHVRVVKHGLITLYYILRIGIALRTRKIRAAWRSLKSHYLPSI